MIAVFAGLIAAASVLAAPAQADPASDAFLAAVTNAGLGSTVDPANVVAVGQSVCPMLSDSGQNAADIAAKAGFLLELQIVRIERITAQACR